MIAPIMGSSPAAQRWMAESLPQLAFDIPSTQARGALARDDEQVRSRPQRGAATAEKFSDVSLDPIANHRIADFAADSDP